MRMRTTRLGIVAVLLTSAALTVGVALPAQADETRSGTVNLALPARVHINGNPVVVQVSGDGLRVNDAVAVVVRNQSGQFMDDSLGVYKGGTLNLGFTSTQIGTWQATTASITHLCSYTDPVAASQNCEQDYSDGPFYEQVTGLTVQPSQVVTAKYDSHISFAAHVIGKGSKRLVNWVASITHYTRDNGWVPWRNTIVLLDGHEVATNQYGHVLFTTAGSKPRTETITVPEQSTIWGSSKTLTR